MTLIPMAEYFAWNCDWCDSSNYTVWNRIDGNGLDCTACHHPALLAESPRPEPRSSPQDAPRRPGL